MIIIKPEEKTITKVKLNYNKKQFNDNSNTYYY